MAADKYQRNYYSNHRSACKPRHDSLFRTCPPQSMTAFPFLYLLGVISFIDLEHNIETVKAVKADGASVSCQCWGKFAARIHKMLGDGVCRGMIHGLSICPFQLHSMPGLLYLLRRHLYFTQICSSSQDLMLSRMLHFLCAVP